MIPNKKYFHEMFNECYRLRIRKTTCPQYANINALDMTC